MSTERKYALQSVTAAASAPRVARVAAGAGAAGAAEAAGASQPLALGARNDCRVLVVDDDDLVRARLAVLLNDSRYQVAEAATGEQALRVLSTTDCRIVITDWQMPDMDGLTLCRELRLKHSSCYRYIMMLTVRSAESDKLTALAAGADDYLTKRATVEEIMARLEIGRRITDWPVARRPPSSEAWSCSHTDPVTGEHNLAYFLEHLPRELARAQRHGHGLAILTCEVEGLQPIINQSGFAAGEAAMRDVISRCDASIRKADWTARTDVGQFMVVLPETRAAGAQRVAQKLRSLFALDAGLAPRPLSELALSITVTAIDGKHEVDGQSRIRSLLRAAHH